MHRQILLTSILLSFNFIYTMEDQQRAPVDIRIGRPDITAGAPESLDRGLDAWLDKFTRDLIAVPGTAIRATYDWVCAVRRSTAAIAYPTITKKIELTK
jgi:hypothetical protein